MKSRYAGQCWRLFFVLSVRVPGQTAYGHDPMGLGVRLFSWSPDPKLRTIQADLLFLIFDLQFGIAIKGRIK